MLCFSEGVTRCRNVSSMVAIVKKVKTKAPRRLAILYILFINFKLPKKRQTIVQRSFYPYLLYILKGLITLLFSPFQKPCKLLRLRK